MSTSFAQLAAPDAVCADPSKHVNYTLGMLLGVDDFNQEFTYLSNRDRWLARDAVGYGTLCGLKVTVDATVRGPRVSITAGTALSPLGQLICMSPAQCAYLNDWLQVNQSSVSLIGGSPPGSLLNLALVLCYRDCTADSVPIAGEPCRSADDLMAPSRIVDDFRLEFRVTPPAQQEEDAVRDFVAWLDQIVVTDGAGTFASLPDFEAALRASVTLSSPPTVSTYFQFGSPLAGIQVHTADIGRYLRSAFRIWATEIRPLFHASPGTSAGCNCVNGDAASPPSEPCLLLAEFEVPVVNVGPGQNWQVDDTQSVVLDESRRPILLHSRMLQEWMQSGLGSGI